jgi:hypothetical protein
MKTLTFSDFTFKARHHIPTKHGAAALSHWHTYSARFYFTETPDQDDLSQKLQNRYSALHGNSLNSFLDGKSSDEEVAAWFLSDVQEVGKCCKVFLTNDYQRGAEVSL